MWRPALLLASLLAATVASQSGGRAALLSKWVELQPREAVWLHPSVEIAENLNDATDPLDEGDEDATTDWGLHLRVRKDAKELPADTELLRVWRTRIVQAEGPEATAKALRATAARKPEPPSNLDKVVRQGVEAALSLRQYLLVAFAPSTDGGPPTLPLLPARLPKKIAAACLGGHAQALRGHVGADLGAYDLATSAVASRAFDIGRTTAFVPVLDLVNHHGPGANVAVKFHRPRSFAKQGVFSDREDNQEDWNIVDDEDPDDHEAEESPGRMPPVAVENDAPPEKPLSWAAMRTTKIVRPGEQLFLRYSSNATTFVHLADQFGFSPPVTALPKVAAQIMFPVGHNKNQVRAADKEKSEKRKKAGKDHPPVPGGAPGGDPDSEENLAEAERQYERMRCDEFVRLTFDAQTGAPSNTLLKCTILKILRRPDMMRAFLGKQLPPHVVGQVESFAHKELAKAAVAMAGQYKSPPDADCEAAIDAMGQASTGDTGASVTEAEARAIVALMHQAEEQMLAVLEKVATYCAARVKDVDADADKERSRGQANFPAGKRRPDEL